MHSTGPKDEISISQASALPDEVGNWRRQDAGGIWFLIMHTPQPSSDLLVTGETLRA